MADAEPLLQEYLRHISLERGLAPNTVSAYRRDLEQYLAHLGKAGVKPLDAGPEHVDEFLWVLRAERGLAPKSVARKLEAVRAFYAFQAAEERVEQSPVQDVPAPRLPARLPRVLSREQVEKLLDSLRGGSYESLRARAMIELLYATGMRVSELTGLRSDAVHLEDGWVRVLGKGAKERMIPIHGRARDALRDFLRAREARFDRKPTGPEVFLSRRGRRMSRHVFWKELAAMGRKAGLGTRLHPHLLRHTFATHLVQNGADLRSVQELLGHRSLATTHIYTHLDPSGLKAAHQKAHPRG